MNAAQVAQFSLIKDLLWPYFPVEPSHGGPTPSYARTRCMFQIDYLQHEVLPEVERWLPRLRGDEVPKWLGRTEPRRSLDRVKAMLAHLASCLEASDADPFHRPLLYLGHEGRHEYVTSPALLALHAVLYSHARWGERHFHDVESAVTAERLLSHYPEFVRRCISSLVLLKNVFRTSAVADDWQRETGVWRAGRLYFDRGHLVPALARLVCRLWDPPRDGRHYLPNDADLRSAWYPGLAAALSLVARCYDARVGAPGAAPEFDAAAFVQLEHELTKALMSRTHTDDEPEDRGDTLVLFEFGRYVFDRNTAAGRESFVARLLPTADDRQTKAPDLLWISLNRYWALHHGQSIGTPDAALLGCLEEKADQDQPMCTTKAGIRGRFHFLNLDADRPENQAAAYRVAFDLKDALPDGDVWTRLARVIEQLRAARAPLGDHGMPWAYIIRALEILAHIYPRDFLTLLVERPQPLTEAAGSLFGSAQEPPRNCMALPRSVPTEDELGRSVAAGDWLEPKLLVARAFAALLINQRMTFGNVRQLIRVEHSHHHSPGTAKVLADAAVEWLKRAYWISEKDNHQVLLQYLDVYGSMPVDDVQPPTVGGRAGAYLLGIDIGATGVKVGVYTVEGTPLRLGGTVLRNVEFKVARPALAGAVGRPQYPDLASFVCHLDAVVAAQIAADPGLASASWVDIKRDLAGVGITWPGAVGGELGHERVRSWSKILSEFQGYRRGGEDCAVPDEKFFWAANAQELHAKFRIREAFAHHFFPDLDPRDAPVTLVNDGDAHVLHAYYGARPAAASEGVRQELVVLAAGTGTAMGAIDATTGSLLDLLAEAGKVIVDIGCPFNSGSGYPVGTGGKLFSKETLKDLAGEALEQWGIPPQPPCLFTEPLLIGYLLADIDPESANKQQEKQELERQWAGPERPPLEECAGALDAVLRERGKTPRQFVEFVTQRMGRNLADLVALTTELFGARVVFASGGPMSGTTGRRVLEFAKQELHGHYRFHVVADDEHAPGTPHYLARLLRLTSPAVASNELSGAHGAAVRALYLLHQRSQ